MIRGRLLLAGGLTLLSLQGVATLALSRSEYLPSPPSLTTLPEAAEAWAHRGDTDIDEESLKMLGPDDYISRTYASSEGQLNLFVAYYKTRHRARNAHDPKVCLPGSGWNSLESRMIDFLVRDSATPVNANYYLVQKNNIQAVVVYWYQTYKGTVVQESMVHLNRVLQSLRDKRTDVAFVSIVVPVTTSAPAARDQAISFARSFQPQLMQYFQ